MAFDRDEHKREWHRKRYHFNVSLIARWKVRKGCCVCGYKKHHAGLVLNHLDQTTKDRNKKGNRAYNPAWGKARLKAELAKCNVMCATCHNVHSYVNDHSLFRGGELGSTPISKDCKRL